MLKKLPQLLQGLECSIIGAGDIEITHLTNDSRQVKAGSMFFAIKGYRDDGRRYIDFALKAGMVSLVIDEPLPSCPVTQIIVRDVRRAQSIIAMNFFDNPARSLTTIGITGTNGKSTSAFMVDSILSAQGFKTGLMGTLYNKLGSEIQPTRHTTPDSIICQGLLCEMVRQQVSHLTMEVSSHAMVMDRVTGIPFAAGGLTNFSPDHLDLHHDIADYFQAKKKFFDALPPTAIALINADDKHSEPMVKDCQARVITYGIEEVADIMATSIYKTSSGHKLEIAVTRSLPLPDGQTIESMELDATVQVPGRHNIYNALLAASITLGLGLQPSAVSAGINRFQGLFRRCEQIWQGEYTVIDDATHNPGNMNALFETVTDNKSSYVVVYGVRGNRGQDINRELAKTLGDWSRLIPIKKIIVTNCIDTASENDYVLPQEDSVFRSELLQNVGCQAEFTETLRNAVVQAVQSVAKGDTLLLLGAHPMDDVASIFAQEAGVEIKTLPRPPAFGS